MCSDFEGTIQHYKDDEISAFILQSLLLPNNCAVRSTKVVLWVA